MPRFHNKVHAAYIKELRQKGLSNQQIADKMTEETGITYTKNKVLRYRREYIQ